MDYKTQLLHDVWENCTFDEILDAGFNSGKCGAIDLKVAATEFDDPEHEIDDDEFMSEIHNRGVREIISILLNLYHTSDILDEFDEDDRLDGIDEDTLLDKLEGSSALEKHDKEVADNTYREYVDEWIDELDISDKQFIEMLQDANSDDLRCFFCDLFGIGYYDEDGLFDGFRKLFEKLEKTIYKDKRELKWLLTKE